MSTTDVAIVAVTTDQPNRPPAQLLSPRVLRSLIPSLAINTVVSLVVYNELRPHVASDAVALAVAMAIPVTYTAITFAWRRTVDPIGVISVTGFVIGLIGALLTGGSALAFKLQDPVETAAIGLICLGSVAVHRPLHLVGLRYLARHSQRAAAMLADPARRRTSTVVTAGIGAIFLTHATPSAPSA